MNKKLNVIFILVGILVALIISIWISQVYFKEATPVFQDDIPIHIAGNKEVKE
ncbi:hypothetical protein MZM54_04365 [[Brevibacterium] frigoritolerans]|nr:hypothetical protein [Peribacillus frigoritolerans]